MSNDDMTTDDSGRGTSSAAHVPVLSARVQELLDPAMHSTAAVFVDMTLGLGGHAAQALRAWPGCHLVGIDRDPAALAIARTRLAEFAGRVDFVHAENDRLPGVLTDLGIRAVQAVLFDLGVSSMQLDTDDRGFSYSRDVELDMRMNPTQPHTAASVLAEYSQADLTRMLRVYGEERFAPRIAAAIVRRRESAPLTTTGELAALVADAVPAAARRKGSGHPAKKTFQAVRIEVNGELDLLRSALPAAVAALAMDGRIAVLSYHSLEDRLTKQTLADAATSHVPAGVPVVPEEYQPTLRLLTRGAEKATDAEITQNPRARSARLRAAVRIKEAA